MHSDEPNAGVRQDRQGSRRLWEGWQGKTLAKQLRFTLLGRSSPRWLANRPGFRR